MAVLGLLDENFEVIYRGRVRGKRAWTIDVKAWAGRASRLLLESGDFLLLESGDFLLLEGTFNDSAASSITYIDIFDGPDDITLEYGLSVGELWAKVLSSRFTFAALDRDGSIFNLLRASRLAGDGDEDWRVEVYSDDGVYHFEHILNLRQLKSLATNRYGFPAIEFNSYDGSVLSDRQPVLLSDVDSFHGIYRNILSYSLVPLDISYVVGWTANNATAGPSLPRIAIPALNPLTGSVAPDQALEIMSDQYLSRLWMGMDHRWHIAQPFLLGQDLVSGSGGQYFSYVNVDNQPATETDEVLAVAVTDSPTTLIDTDFIDTAEVLGEDIIRRVSLARRESFSAGGSIILNGDPAFEYWPALNELYHYDVPQGSILRDARGRTGFCPQIIPPAGAQSILRYRGLSWPAGAPAFFHITFYWAVDATAGAPGGTDSLEYQVYVRAFDQVNDQDYYWNDAGGAYTTVVTTNMDGPQAIEAAGSNPLTWHQVDITIDEPFPVQGELRIDFLGWDGVGTSVYFYVDDFYTTLQDIDGNDVSEMGLDITFRVIDQLIVRQGISQDYTREQINIESDTDGFPVQALQAAGTWLKLAKMIDHNGDEYFDLARLLFDTITGEDNSQLSRLRGTARRLLPPEDVITYQGTNYLLLSGRLKLIPEFTDGEWIKQPEG